ncbi:endonuclease V [Planotetraspora sp. GP83]|uniref:endonuclease V n=1 Tax=Planotetraspora sp. GP83 TaxID=3156264 RepID=UPI0035174FBB
MDYGVFVTAAAERYQPSPSGSHLTGTVGGSASESRVRHGGHVLTSAQGAVPGLIAFDYAPGLLAFRELPSLVRALERLTVTPDLIVCDGYGVAHPRRFGLACHLGVLTGLPTIGVGKTAFVGTYDEPGRDRGAWSELRLDGDVVGRVLRTQDGVKPVFVSVGHRADMDTAFRNVLALSPSHRLPETTREADRLSRDALRTALQGDRHRQRDHPARTGIRGFPTHGTGLAQEGER